MITADEDMDWIDIIAFISITPLLYELANLLMKPMLDMIFDKFHYYFFDKSWHGGYYE